MPSGTATSAASTKPPNTRQTVTPISSRKPCLVSSSQPSSSIVSGSARKVLDTKPPSVANAQAAKNRTKNKMPRKTRAAFEMGASGRISRPLSNLSREVHARPRHCEPKAKRSRTSAPQLDMLCRRAPHNDAASLNETRIRDLAEVGHRLDDA